MALPLKVRNLSATPILIVRIEQFEDPNTAQTKANGYLFSSKNTTSAAPTSPELSGCAQSFNHQDLDITLQPLESYTLTFPDLEQSDNTPTLLNPTLRLTISASSNERHRLDTHPSYTQRSSQFFTPLSPNPKTTYKALFHPSKPTPHLTIHTNHLPDYTSWMAALPDTLPLSAISIPGTHNSHTHYRALPSVRCQIHDITTQLENGIRFLDIRVQPAHATDTTIKDLYLVHGAFPVSLTGSKYLEPVLSTIYEFLATHPSETIILSLKREGAGNATDAHLSQILDEHYISPQSQTWYTGTTIPYLGAARGKIVLLRRYHYHTTTTPSGLDATPWPHNSTHALFPSSPSLPTFCLQDFCDVLVPDLIPTKILHANDHLVRAASAVHHIPGISTDAQNPVPPGPLYLNYLSASNFWKRACWPERIAKVVNGGVEEWVCCGLGLVDAEADTTPEEGEVAGGTRKTKSGDGSCGVVVMDCVGEKGDWELVGLVIGMNMGVLAKCGVGGLC
ncbi:1-phosphatidylinositol phosphodiesterase precursor [Decorospora gaudefroyi]|uniref:1-phosphatidylinositol phosphodiesterase n=1 Tax=Decorospora gaudefroyi TaxID=184978 RepID=A0A6A5K720_9PLEO|nr:1-phosphatidylinositol phosphodiesterase precursor [Decorospora gaudefroyi]